MTPQIIPTQLESFSLITFAATGHARSARRWQRPWIAYGWFSRQDMACGQSNGGVAGSRWNSPGSPKEINDDPSHVIFLGNCVTLSNQPAIFFLPLSSGSLLLAQKSCCFPFWSCFLSLICWALCGFEAKQSPAGAQKAELYSARRVWLRRAGSHGTPYPWGPWGLEDKFPVKHGQGGVRRGLSISHLVILVLDPRKDTVVVGSEWVPLWFDILFAINNSQPTFLASSLQCQDFLTPISIVALDLRSRERFLKLAHSELNPSSDCFDMGPFGATLSRIDQVAAAALNSTCSILKR